MSYNDILKHILTKFESIIENPLEFQLMINRGEISIEELMDITDCHLLNERDFRHVKLCLTNGLNVLNNLRSWIK